MTATMDERTVLPPARPERLSQVLGLLGREEGSRAALVAPDGTRLELPAELFEVLHEIVQALSCGLAVTIAPHHTVLTTSEAAQMLGISRPTLVRLLESGEIPFDQPARHRRVRLADVLAYQARAGRARAVSLDEMVRVSEDDGLYDLLADASVERLPIDHEHG